MYNRDSESIIYVDAIPLNQKTSKQKKLWRWIAGIVAAVVVIVVIIVVAVIVSDNKKKNQSSKGTYTISSYAQMTKLTTINDLTPETKPRVYVIGDVHGCIDEFNALVNKLNYNPLTDQLILAGDITSKGPDSVAVIRRAKALGALCVRGNHDDKVIRLKTYQLARGGNAMKPPSATMPEGNVPDPLKFKNYHTAIALNMTQDDYDYLSSCPVMLHLPYYNNTIVVHAGLDPSVSTLENQEPYLVMNMRNIVNNQPTPEDTVGLQWANVWQSSSNSYSDAQIFYGHASSRGLSIKQKTFGIDTGCVSGKRLTAINILTKSLTQVNCLSYANNVNDEE